METKTFQEKVKKVNELLKSGEPNNFTNDHKGYAGYKPQWVIDSVNSEFSGQWSMDTADTPVVRDSGRKNKNGQAICDALISVTVSFEEAGSIKTWASHPITDDFGDAVKSASTDAMKKAFAHFSIGNRAYHGLLGK